jgi:hypothetical protein
MEETPRDPRLKAALEEIRAIVEKHDVSAVIALAVPDQLEYLIHPQASWNCIEVTERELRVNSLRFPKEERPYRVKGTASVLIGLGHICEYFTEEFGKATQMMGQHFEINHWMRRQK